MITLYHHPWSRAANTVWMLEEIGIDYELSYVDLHAGAQKSEGFLNQNPMGKLPTLVDDEVVVTESAAIGIYLADRYASGRLAPALDDPRRATYLRWSLFAPSVIEPGAYAKMADWEYKEGTVGWGNYQAMMRAVVHAIEGKAFVLGDQFSMADMIFGGTVRYMLQFDMIDKTDVLVDYAQRLSERPAAKKAEAINAAVIEDKGLAP